MLDHPQVRKLIQLAISEDLGAGDLTSELCIDAALESTARIVARENLVVCGLALIEMIFQELGWTVQVQHHFADGAEARSEEILSTLSAKTRHLLAAERILLNFLQRMCGVASYTKSFVAAAQGMTVLDTRKTTPGWRLLEKYAVKVGGAKNHRFHLSDLVLVKNNHIDAARRASGKSVSQILQQIVQAKPANVKLEVEVRNLEELQQALAVNPDIVMLDNMDDAQISAALDLVERAKSKTEIEISGGVSLPRLGKLSALGVKCVSVGALTRKATSVDISMRIT